MAEPPKTPLLQREIDPARRLLVVSHPAVLGVNQLVYRELAERGWRVDIVVPRRWRSEYSSEAIIPEALPGLEGSLHPVPVLLSGRPQRHLYLTRCRALASRLAANVAFLEAETYSLAASQWRRALSGLGIPFGVQAAENIDRPLPGTVRRLRSRVLEDAAFVAARSETAGELVRTWGARGEVGLAPHAVPGWTEIPQAPAGRPFTVGFAGRLTGSKGLEDLLAAVRLLQSPVELLLIGNGELREQLEGAEIPGGHVRVLDGLSHEQMARGYAQLDVLALPSHTTPTWKEQFGRVIVEALWCGVPVVGSDSGEIPWLIGLTGGGLVFKEGDVEGLAAALSRLREEPQLRASLAQDGRASVERMFTVPAATNALERLLLGALGSR
jgi:glycosyltransferase involved in cell wall biosynthesis